MPYHPLTGGHAPGHIRDRFAEAVENADINGQRAAAGYVWNCTDVMPSHVCELLDLTAGATYAQGARAVRS